MPNFIRPTCHGNTGAGGERTAGIPWGWLPNSRMAGTARDNPSCGIRSSSGNLTALVRVILEIWRLDLYRYVPNRLTSGQRIVLCQLGHCARGETWANITWHARKGIYCKARYAMTVEHHTATVTSPNFNAISPQNSIARSPSMGTQGESIRDIARPTTPGNVPKSNPPTHSTPIRHDGVSSAAVSSSKLTTVSRT